MILWLETLGVIALAAGATWGGRHLARHHWKLGYGVSLGLVVLVALGRRFPEIGTMPPVSWMMTGRLEYLLMAAAIPVLLICLLGQISRVPLRAALYVLLVAGVGCYALPAFAGPALMQGRYRTMSNQYQNGICQQQTAYTCGPAAAVSALEYLGLEHLGLTANEGELAITARTSPLTGTDLDLLASVLESRYPVTTRIISSRDATQVQAGQVALAVVTFSRWVDHYVAILEQSGDTVVVADPAAGRVTMSQAEFREWSQGVMLIIEIDSARTAHLTEWPIPVANIK